MSDVNTVAEPSAANNRIQYDSWDEKGTPIVSKSHEKETPKKEEPAASAATAKESQSEAKAKSAAEAETAESQEKQKERKPGEKKSADERIAELIAENKRLKLKDEERERSREKEKAPEPASKVEAKVEAKPAKDAQPATYAEWRQAFKPKAWIEQWAKDHPAEGYEDAVAALGDFQAEMRASYQQLEMQQQKGRERASEQLRKTVEKYPDAEPKVKETAKTLMQADVPPFVRAFIDDSEVMTDLLYTLSDKATLDNVLETAKTQPGKALRVLRDMELEIEKAVAKPAADKADDKGESKDKEEKPPAEPKPRAPKPPVEVGGRGTGNEDPSVAAARTGDYRAFEAAENAKLKARHAKA